MTLSVGNRIKMCSTFYFFLRWCPGGLGLLLRQKLYPFILGSCGRKVLFGRFVNIENPKKIHLGDYVVINDNVTLDAGGCHEQGPAVMLGDKVFIGAGSRLHAEAGKIFLQSGSSIGSFCVFETKCNITVGAHVLLAAYCTIGYCPTEFNFLLQEKKSAGDHENDIKIGSGCWLGVRSIILPGIIIGEGSIVGAHAVVHNTLPSYVVAVGVPAEIMRNRSES